MGVGVAINFRAGVRIGAYLQQPARLSPGHLHEMAKCITAAKTRLAKQEREQD
jgi:hypothetical protein